MKAIAIQGRHGNIENCWWIYG